MFHSEASAAPLAFQADKINLTISSTPTPFLTCANRVGPPSLGLVRVRQCITSF